MLHRFDSPLSRRQILLGSSALAAAALAAGPAGAASGRRYDWSDPNDNLEAYIKLTNSLEDRDWVYGWYSGLVFGMLPNRTPDALFGLEGFGLGYTVRQENGTYISYWKEVGFYKDLKSNQVIETWTNPYTGETNRVMHIHNRMVKGYLGPRFFAAAPVGDQAGRMEFKFPNYRASDDPQNPFVLNWTEMGDQTSVWMDFRGEVPNLLDPKVWVKESSGERLPICEMFEFVGDTAAIHDRSLARVDHSGSWIRLAPWLPWQLMGPAPGRLFYRCTTKSLRGLDELPAPIVAYAERNYPAYLEKKIDENQESESSFEVYMKEREPA